ncbi:unnamed protein product [Ectocarpus sp. 8 AP-2014]
MASLIDEHLRRFTLARSVPAVGWFVLFPSPSAPVLTWPDDAALIRFSTPTTLLPPPPSFPALRSDGGDLLLPSSLMLPTPLPAPLMATPRGPFPSSFRKELVFPRPLRPASSFTPTPLRSPARAVPPSDGWKPSCLILISTSAALSCEDFSLLSPVGVCRAFLSISC